jgi:glycerol-3-phosphate dehydrogenase
LSDLHTEFPWLSPSLLKHYARSYGTRARKLLAGTANESDLGRHFGPDFYEREARFLIETEWARTAADILERRTKHGLRLDAAGRKAFEEWIEGLTVETAL